MKIFFALCLALAYAQDDATCITNLSTAKGCILNAANGIVTSQNVNLEGFKTCAKAATCPGIPHIDPAQLRQCVVQSSLGGKLNDTKACMQAALPNYTPPDLKTEMQNAGARLIASLFILKCGDCDAVTACAAPNNLNVGMLDTAKATCDSNLQSLQTTCASTITKVKQAGCSCFQASFPSSSSIPVADIMQCMQQTTVPELFYPIIANKIYTELQNKLCGDELITGNHLASGTCPPKLPTFG
jgi:hypothetical protein